MLIIANWKMNPQLPEAARDLFAKTKKAAQQHGGVQTVVCPPAVYLGMLAGDTGGRCALGAQDIFWEREGAHTGEISAGQVAGLGARFVIVGHSERRGRGETNADVAKKTSAALKAGLTPVVCVGEYERDEEGAYLSFVREELTESLAEVSKKEFASVAVAYEPIWAVGAAATRADTPDDLLEMAIFIRKVLTETFSVRAAESVPVLYGGSVDERNAEGFLKNGGVSGLLVGRASLDAHEFGEIVKRAASCMSS